LDSTKATTVNNAAKALANTLAAQLGVETTTTTQSGLINALNELYNANSNQEAIDALNDVALEYSLSDQSKVESDLTSDDGTRNAYGLTSAEVQNVLSQTLQVQTGTSSSSIDTVITTILNDPILTCDVQNKNYTQFLTDLNAFVPGLAAAGVSNATIQSILTDPTNGLVFNSSTGMYTAASIQNVANALATAAVPPTTTVLTATLVDSTSPVSYTFTNGVTVAASNLYNGSDTIPVIIISGVASTATFTPGTLPVTDASGNPISGTLTYSSGYLEISGLPSNYTNGNGGATIPFIVNFSLGGQAYSIEEVPPSS
jgi:hypothetical protein